VPQMDRHAWITNQHLSIACGAKGEPDAFSRVLEPVKGNFASSNLGEAFHGGADQQLLRVQVEPGGAGAAASVAWLPVLETSDAAIVESVSRTIGRTHDPSVGQLGHGKGNF
jgi:hypothetical protein